MSGERLSEVLHDLASDHRPMHIDPGIYRRGRRARRRRLALGTAAGTLAAVGLTSVLVPLIEPSGGPTPAGTDVAPALPTRIHAVPERLAQVVGEDDRDTYRWHPDVRARDLAVGRTAAVFPVSSGAVVAVSAEDGSYRGLELPGFDEDAYVRFDGLPVALSPDGSRLAYTWNPYVIGATVLTAYEPSGVRIVDLRSGEVRSVRIVGGYGVYAHGFSWSPDGRYLAYDLDVTSDGTGRVDDGWAERLDTATGERAHARGLPATDTGPVVSDRGEVAVTGNGPPATWAPGRRPAVRSFDGGGDDWTAAWSPDGRRLATGSRDRGWFSVGSPSGRGLVSATASDAPPGSPVVALGWAGDDEVALLHRSAEQMVVSAVPVSAPAGGDGRLLVEVEAEVAPTQLSLATALLDRPARAFPEPEWPTDPTAVVVRSALGALALAAAWAWLRRRERRRRTARDES